MDIVPPPPLLLSEPTPWPESYQLPDTVSMSAIDLSNAIHAGDISCTEVMKDYLAHISALNPIVNAIVSLRDADELIAEATQLDNELGKGHSRGWLHGIPQAIKDLSSTAGIRTTLGSPLMTNHIPDTDSIMVSRIKRDGAIIIGKTNTPEFGFGSQTFNTVFGATRNAYHPHLTAGGSSGGGAVALALRMLPVADGSDMMGSLRNPAAYQNIYGLRPTFGRVPSGPNPELFGHQLSTEGPMARNIEDLQRLLVTQSGHDPRVPLSLTDSPANLSGDLNVCQRGKRIAWLGDWQGELPVEPGVLALCETAVKQFEQLGCIIESPAMPMSMESLWKSWLTLRHWAISGNLADTYQDPEKRRLLKSEAQWEIEQGINLSALDIHKANVTRSQWYTALNKMFQHYDYVMLPSAQCFPFPVTTAWPSEIAGQRMDTYHRWMQIVIPGSLAGCPVLNIPAGFNDNDLPMGIQVLAPHRAELVLLQLGQAYHSISPSWKHRLPPFFSE
ncbi:MAG: amidase [Halomonas sp.]|nr:amidase [Halomonas sp.]TVP47633.1 MAG: amidase [Halomonas sp.]